MQRNTGYFPTESLEPSGNRLFSRSALNEGYLFRGSLELTQEWDKVFPKSNKVDHQKITFHNRYGITLAADMQDTCIS